jgi:hypothetical protein
MRPRFNPRTILVVIAATLMIAAVVIGFYGGFIVACMLSDYEALLVPLPLAALFFGFIGMLTVLKFELLFIVIPAAVVYFVYRTIRRFHDGN